MSDLLLFNQTSKYVVAVVMAQLAKRSLVRIIQTSAKFLMNIVYCQLYWKDENKEKRPEVAHFFKKTSKYAQTALSTYQGY